MIHASERDTERVQLKRAGYQSEITAQMVGRLKFLDEAGSNIAMTRLYGRAAPGERVVDNAPQNYGENITMLATLSLDGIAAPMTVAGAVDGIVFKTYVEKVLAPTLLKGDIVIMDNLGAHKVAGVGELIEARGARVIYLPPYSPDLNPIEKCWSKIKTYLRAAKARTREALEQALKEVLLTISEKDARGWFASCGYSLH
jgi:transposase